MNATGVGVGIPHSNDDWVYEGNGSPLATSGSLNIVSNIWTVGTVAAGATHTLQFRVYPKKSNINLFAQVTTTTQQDCDSAPNNGTCCASANEDDEVVYPTYPNGSVRNNCGGTPNNPPVASFTHNATNLSVSFTNTSTDSNGDNLTYIWSFGDNNSSIATSPSHTYSAAGTYIVSLTANDGKGGTNATSKNVTVTAPTGGCIPPINLIPSNDWNNAVGSLPSGWPTWGED